jgi:oxygen-independent coproporphyrinogen-3 oxidase
MGGNEMSAEWPRRAIRDFLVREHGGFAFQPRHDVRLPKVDTADLYVHIPFCESLCPYCPYNRTLYDAELAALYVRTLHNEIEHYYGLLGDIEIGSIYFGGGTPTTLLADLGSIIEHIRGCFRHKGPIAIETIPNHLEPETLSVLRSSGVSLLSIGVQSFDDRYLQLIGRRYRADILPAAISAALAAGFDSVNLDLIFALPGQTTDETLADLDRALGLGAEQVTLYPLFTFPYSAVGNHLHLQHVNFPGLIARRRMYRALHDKAIASGLKRVSVWGFRKNDAPIFSSVTRDNYVGVGAGAATCLPGIFYFNTFSIREYIRGYPGFDLPVALQMPMTPTMERFFWLYWRLYETFIPKGQFVRLFAHDRRVRWLLSLALHLHLLNDENSRYALTERGSFWIHLLQNVYVLNYINTVWTRCMHEAWPGRIDL